MGRSNKGRGKQMCNSGDKTKKTVAAATGPAGTLYKLRTKKDAASFNQTNDAMVEYIWVLLGPVASEAVRTLTLTRLVSTIGEKTKRKYHFRHF